MAITADLQSRKWQITINNPLKKGYTREHIKETLSCFKSCVYWCASDEVGEGGTPHVHIFFACASAVRFSTVKSRFEGGHFEIAHGTCSQNRDYVFKLGKWETDKKHETNLPETHEEWGEMPVERQGQRNDLADLYDMVRGGMTNAEILEANPSYITVFDKLDRVRLTILGDRFRQLRRENIHITYIQGPAGCGKTRYVRDKYGDVNVYSVDDYRKHPFDSYNGEDVLLLDEYRNSFSLGYFLKVTDVYPLHFSTRYCDRYAAYTRVFIVSNWVLEKQYADICREDKESYSGFLRRIHDVMVWENGAFKIYTTAEYLKRDTKFHTLTKEEQQRLPF